MVGKLEVMKETVYTSDSQLRSPRIFFRDLIDDLPATREIGWRFFVHNLRSQYRRSWLGYLWLIIPPLMTTLVWVYLNRVNLLNISTPDIPYPVYVLTGTFL